MYTLTNGIKDILNLKKKYGENNLKIDLGCGYYKPNGFIGLDNGIGFENQIENQTNLPDILMDLNIEKYPFENNEVSIVRTSHFLEHSNIEHVINETYRILKKGGKFHIIVPYANSAEGMYPGHNCFLTEKWFYENLNFQNKFKIVKEIYYKSKYYKKFPKLLRVFIPFRYSRIFLFNACWQMKLICKKK